MQRLFFQITITLNPIIIHKLWEKIFHQSWWEIKVRRPRHGNDSIFPNTLQRPPLGPLLVTIFKSLTFVLSLVVTRWCDPPEVWGQVAPSPGAAGAEPEPLHRSQTRSRSQVPAASGTRRLTAVTQTETDEGHWTNTLLLRLFSEYSWCMIF